MPKKFSDTTQSQFASENPYAPLVNRPENGKLKKKSARQEQPKAEDDKRIFHAEASETYEDLYNRFRPQRANKKEDKKVKIREVNSSVDLTDSEFKFVSSFIKFDNDVNPQSPEGRNMSRCMVDSLLRNPITKKRLVEFIQDFKNIETSNETNPVFSETTGKIDDEKFLLNITARWMIYTNPQKVEIKGFNDSGEQDLSAIQLVLGRVKNFGIFGFSGIDISNDSRSDVQPGEKNHGILMPLNVLVKISDKFDNVDYMGMSTTQGKLEVVRDQKFSASMSLETISRPQVSDATLNVTGNPNYDLDSIECLKARGANGKCRVEIDGRKIPVHLIVFDGVTEDMDGNPLYKIVDNVCEVPAPTNPGQIASTVATGIFATTSAITSAIAGKYTPAIGEEIGNQSEDTIGGMSLTNFGLAVVGGALAATTAACAFYKCYTSIKDSRDRKRHERYGRDLEEGMEMVEIGDREMEEIMQNATAPLPSPIAAVVQASPVRIGHRERE